MSATAVAGAPIDGDDMMPVTPTGPAPAEAGIVAQLLQWAVDNAGALLIGLAAVVVTALVTRVLITALRARLQARHPQVGANDVDVDADDKRDMKDRIAKARARADKATTIIGVFGSLVSMASTLYAYGDVVTSSVLAALTFLAIAALIELIVVMLAYRAMVNVYETRQVGLEGRLLWVVALGLSTFVWFKQDDLMLRLPQAAIPFTVALSYSLSLRAMARRARGLNVAVVDDEQAGHTATAALRDIRTWLLAKLGLGGDSPAARIRHKAVVKVAQLSISLSRLAADTDEQRKARAAADAEYRQEMAKLTSRYGNGVIAEVTEYLALILDAEELTTGDGLERLRAQRAAAAQAPQPVRVKATVGRPPVQLTPAQQPPAKPAPQRQAIGPGPDMGPAGEPETAVNPDKRESPSRSAARPPMTWAEVDAVRDSWTKEEYAACAIDVEVALDRARRAGRDAVKQGGSIKDGMRRYYLVMRAAGYPVGSTAVSANGMYTAVADKPDTGRAGSKATRQWDNELGPDPRGETTAPAAAATAAADATAPADVVDVATAPAAVAATEN